MSTAASSSSVAQIISEGPINFYKTEPGKAQRWINTVHAALSAAYTEPVLPAPSAVVYPVADAENLERLHSDLKASLDEQVRLLAQRRRLAGHLRGALQKHRLAEGAVSMMNDQVRQARAATAAAEQRLDRSMQMQASLQADLQSAYSYRGSAIVRATAAEARAAAAERALTQVLNAQHPTTLFSRLWSRLVSRTSEVTA